MLDLRAPMTASPPSAELVERVAAGDSEAADELVARHWEETYRLAYRCLRQPQDAEDVAQQATLALLRRAGSFRPGSAFRPWYRTLVFNAVRDHLRRAQRRAAREGDVASRRTRAIEAVSEQRALEREVMEHVAALEDDLRLPLLLHYGEGYTHREVAAALGCPAGTASSRIRRGLERLQASLGAGLGVAGLAALQAALQAGSSAPAPPAAPSAASLLLTRAATTTQRAGLAGLVLLAAIAGAAGASWLSAPSDAPGARVVAAAGPGAAPPRRGAPPPGATPAAGGLPGPSASAGAGPRPAAGPGAGPRPAARGGRPAAAPAALAGAWERFLAALRADELDQAKALAARLRRRPAGELVPRALAALLEAQADMRRHLQPASPLRRVSKEALSFRDEPAYRAARRQEWGVEGLLLDLPSAGAPEALEQAYRAFLARPAPEQGEDPRWTAATLLRALGAQESLQALAAARGLVRDGVGLPAEGGQVASLYALLWTLAERGRGGDLLAEVCEGRLSSDPGLVEGARALLCEGYASAAEPERLWAQVERLWASTPELRASLAGALAQSWLAQGRGQERLAAVLADADPALRRAAVAAIGRLVRYRPLDLERVGWALGQLEPLAAEDAAPEVRRLAGQVAAELRQAAALQRAQRAGWESLAQERSEAEHLAAIRAAVRSQGPARAVAPLERAVLTRLPGRRAALIALWALTSEPPSPAGGFGRHDEPSRAAAEAALLRLAGGERALRREVLATAHLPEWGLELSAQLTELVRLELDAPEVEVRLAALHAHLTLGGRLSSERARAWLRAPQRELRLAAVAESEDAALLLAVARDTQQGWAARAAALQRLSYLRVEDEDPLPALPALPRFALAPRAAGGPRPLARDEVVLEVDGRPLLDAAAWQGAGPVELTTLHEGRVLRRQLSAEQRAQLRPVERLARPFRGQRAATSFWSP